MKTNTAALRGIDAYPVSITCYVEPGLPAFDFAGVTELTAKESRVRVRSAIRHGGLAFPQMRVTATVDSPDAKADATALDLPLALAVLGKDTGDDIVFGELSLTGALRPVVGGICYATLAKQLGVGVVCPADNAKECLAVLPPDKVRAYVTLRDVVDDVRSSQIHSFAQHPVHTLCWSDVRGHSIAKRVLEIAAAGGHNIVLVGHPGTGKTMLARRLPTILPPMTQDEAIECTTLHSVAGLLPTNVGLLQQRPFRAPHHTASAASLVGGGSRPTPGECSLAHNGVLLLDELPEFPRHVLETLRTPLEDGKATVNRAKVSVTFPAQALVVAAMNPCPCGYLGDNTDRCKCPPLALERYQSRTKGPLLHSFDLQIRLPQIEPSQLRDGPVGDTSETVRARVTAARQRQSQRWNNGCTNATVSMTVLRKDRPLIPVVHSLLLKAMDAWQMPPRAHDHIWRLAATIADLGGSDIIDVGDLAEALHYRFFDRPGA